jgi:hypothetical protein
VLELEKESRAAQKLLLTSPMRKRQQALTQPKKGKMRAYQKQVETRESKILTAWVWMWLGYIWIKLIVY